MVVFAYSPSVGEVGKVGSLDSPASLDNLARLCLPFLFFASSNYNLKLCFVFIVCVCMCKRAREREKERERHITLRPSYHHIYLSLVYGGGAGRELPAHRSLYELRKDDSSQAQG